MRLWRQAGRQLAREWRAGELQALFLAVVIAIAAMASVASFSDRIEAALTRNAGALIAADLRLGARQPLDGSWLEQARQAGLDTARVTRFNSVVLHDGNSQLSAIKAVEPAYPLRGRLLLADTAFGDTREVRRGPAPGEVWLEPRLANTLGLTVGDTLTLGYVDLTVSALLVDEPDRGGGLFNLSPRLMMAYQDLERAGLLGEGSRARYQLLLAGPGEVVNAFRQRAERSRGDGLRVENVADEQQQVAAAMERGRSFLTLAALTAVLLSGIAVAIAALRFSQRHTDSVATMRCLGATRLEVLSVYALMLVFVGFAALVPGVALGYGVQAILAAVLSPLLAEGLPAPGASGAITASGAGLLILLGFTLAALLRLHGVAPAQVFNRSFQRRGRSLWWLAYAVPVALFCAFVLWQLDDATLAAWVLGGAGVAILALALVSGLLMLALKRLTRGVGVAWRFGLANLFRNGAASVLQICAIGLGLTIILLLTLVRAQLFSTWQASLDDDTPNYFLINIQPDQREDVRSQLAEATGVAEPVLYPMATGRLVGINGRMPQADEFADPRAARRLRGTVNLSWAEELAPSNTLTAGQWWDEDTVGVSLAETWAEPLGLEVGDTMTFRVGSQEVTVPVTSLRNVAWDSFNVNFFLVLHPSLFEQAPRTWLGSFYLPQGGQSLTPLLREYPNINVIDVEAILRQVRQVIDLVSMALNVVFVFTLAAGLAVLVAALQSSRDQRLYQTAMLKALGIDRSRLVWGLNAEFLAIGLLAGLVAAAAASSLAAVLATQVFNLAYRPSPGLLLVSVVAGVAVVFLASRLGMRRVLASPPGVLLREN